MNKKCGLIAFVCMLSLLLVGGIGTGYAAVSGVCSECHTMHNSQEAKIMATDTTYGDAGYGALTRNTCLGCHTTDANDPLDENGYPFVKSSSTVGFSDDNCLAGGFFASNDGTDNIGKAHSLGSTAPPPGYTTGQTWYEGTETGRGLSCAGSAGCHGSQVIDDEMGAIKGGHHSPSVYRILLTYDGSTATGVVGDGATDYEKALIAGTTVPATTYTRTAATNDYNIYKAGTTEDTISKLCANCHGDYHSDIGSASPWTRHPTDVVLPTDFEPRNDALVTNVDAKYNPFGFASISDTTGTKYATCLSCHRAHGTGNYDLLRFAYNADLGDTSINQSAGSENKYGCLGCHSKQR